MNTRTNVERDRHPNFWSFFALVGATLDLTPDTVGMLAAEEELDRLDAVLGTWDFRDVCILAGVVADSPDVDVRFDELLATEVGELVNEWLGD